jgi:DNA primase
MAKISPVSIKYMIHAKFEAVGPVERPDVVGALFGQTEGLLGRDLELRDLQKEGKIGRIEVETESYDSKTRGTIQIPTALDQSETSLIAAAIETIDRVGPTEAKIEVEKIEDVRGNKRDYILDRAKKLLEGMEGGQSSKEISSNLKIASRTSRIKEYGDEKLPAGDLSKKEIIVVEGRADVVNLLENRVDNVVGMNGTKLPKEIAKLGEEKDLTLFVDGDRGGKLIAGNVINNAKIKYIAFAPDGKEVEELSGKEILAALRKKIKAEDFDSSASYSNEISDEIDKENFKDLMKEVDGSRKAYLISSDGKVLKKVSAIQTARSISKTNDVKVVIVDGKITSTIVQACEDANVKLLAGKNFDASSDKIEMISF